MAESSGARHGLSMPRWRQSARAPSRGRIVLKRALTEQRPPGRRAKGRSDSSTRHLAVSQPHNSLPVGGSGISSPFRRRSEAGASGPRGPGSVIRPDFSGAIEARGKDTNQQRFPFSRRGFIRADVEFNPGDAVQESNHSSRQPFRIGHAVAPQSSPKVFGATDVQHPRLGAAHEVNARPRGQLSKELRPQSFHQRPGRREQPELTGCHALQVITAPRTRPVHDKDIPSRLQNPEP
jgi:hypothetical protein